MLAIGPSGSGKTTFCWGLAQYFEMVGRDYIIINLDPANTTMKYKHQIDIKDLITLEDVMEEFKLGPNGGLLYCMEFLEKNVDWLLNQINQPKYLNHYIIIDMPG